MYSNKRPYNRMTVLLQLTHNISTHTHIHHTAGFTIFPHIVAIVHTDPFVVDLYHHYRRRTHTEVPRHFSFFFTFFWQTGASRFLRTSTPWASLAMASLPPPAAHGRKTPVPGQCACCCCPHHGRLPTRSVRSNLSRGGGST